MTQISIEQNSKSSFEKQKKKYGVKLPNFYDLQNMTNVGGILKSISKKLRILHSIIIFKSSYVRCS